MLGAWVVVGLVTAPMYARNTVFWFQLMLVVLGAICLLYLVQSRRY